MDRHAPTKEGREVGGRRDRKGRVEGRREGRIGMKGKEERDEEEERKKG